MNVDGARDHADGNMFKKPEDIDDSRYLSPPAWPLLSRDANGDSFHKIANTDRQVVVLDGPWKLVATYRKTTTYALFNTDRDINEKSDLSVRLEQITFRLRGLIERKEGLDYQAEMRGKDPGR